MFSQTRKRAISLLLFTMSATVLFALSGEAADQKPILKVADRPAQFPGAVAWSPNGKRIAVISDAIVIIDIENSRQKNVPVSNPYFLCWGTDNLLYILHRSEGGKMLFSIDPDTLQRRDIPLTIQPDGIFALPHEKSLIMVAAALDQKRLWSSVTYSLHLFDPKTAATKKIYGSIRILPRHKEAPDYLSGWLWGGLRPGDSAFMTMEPVKPPVVMPYLQVSTVDYITGKAITIGRIESPKFSIPASWSPDGKRFSFADQNNTLQIYDIERAADFTPEKGLPIRGYFPAWNPRGSQIFFGGHIIRSDGQQADMLLPEAEESCGFWSPEGTDLAIAARSGLYILRNYMPALVHPDRVYSQEKYAKLRLLKNLLSEGLISEQEFGERHDVIMKTME